MTAIAAPDLISRIVEEDHRLEDQAERSTQARMHWRWHWTLDESNPEPRLSIRHYADAVGRDYKTIHADVHGYLLLTNDDGERPMRPDDARERVGKAAETVTAQQAVADARGISMVNARQHHQDEIDTVRIMARDRAAERGTAMEEEATKMAQAVLRAKEAERREREDRKRRHTLRFIEVDGELRKMRQHGATALRVSDGVEFDAEEQQLLLLALNHVRRITDMLDEAIRGHRPGDWRDQLRVIEGGIS